MSSSIFNCAPAPLPSDAGGHDSAFEIQPLSCLIWVRHPRNAPSAQKLKLGDRDVLLFVRCNIQEPDEVINRNGGIFVVSKHLEKKSPVVDVTLACDDVFLVFQLSRVGESSRVFAVLDLEDGLDGRAAAAAAAGFRCTMNQTGSRVRWWRFSWHTDAPPWAQDPLECDERTGPGQLLSPQGLGHSHGCNNRSGVGFLAVGVNMCA